MIAMLEGVYPVQKACQMLTFPRSRYYYAPRDNEQDLHYGYAQRLLRTIKEEEVHLSEYQDFQECFQNMDRFLNDVYMYKRIHSSLGYLTPVEF